MNSFYPLLATMMKNQQPVVVWRIEYRTIKTDNWAFSLNLIIGIWNRTKFSFLSLNTKLKIFTKSISYVYRLKLFHSYLGIFICCVPQKAYTGELIAPIIFRPQMARWSWRNKLLWFLKSYEFDVNLVLKISSHIFNSIITVSC